MDELDHQKVIKKIIYKELEPSVLNEEIITKAIYDQGPSGEAGRIFREMEIQHEKIVVLRLEFLNILKIDHLWILPNLQVLSLAFNKIDKIENLEAMVNLKELNLTYNSIEKLENFEGLISLETLSVFGNRIEKIENIDCLENLIIFSAGNNLIETKDGIERLRFLKKLRSLNLKGNEVEKNDRFFRIYIAGLLSNLTYYEYKYISKEERNEGKDRFRFKLREIMDNERVEVLEREQFAKDKENNVHLKACFVENFDKDQLFESMFIFDNEDQGLCLLNIGGEEKSLIAEFREQSSAVTQKIHRIGLEEFEKRKEEQKVFLECVAIGKKKVQIQGQKNIDEFFLKRSKIFEKVNQATADFKATRNSSNEDAQKELLYDKIGNMTDEFNQLHDEMWKILMDSEMHLHESVNESNTTFTHIFQDMVNEFVEHCKTQFVQLRDIESNFIDALVESVQSFVTTMGSTGKEHELPEELRNSLIDRDVIFEFASGMREMHIQKIDGREDSLVVRSSKYVQELCDNLMTNEIERNRRKVMEINFFLDNQQIEFEKLVTDVGVEIENIEDFDDVSSRRSSSLADIDDSLIEDDVAENCQNELGGNIIANQNAENEVNNDSVDPEMKTVQQ